jgi:hypothetical protein
LNLLRAIGWFYPALCVIAILCCRFSMGLSWTASIPFGVFLVGLGVLRNQSYFWASDFGEHLRERREARRERSGP